MSISSFKIVGGILFLLMSINMLNAKTPKAKNTKSELKEAKKKCKRKRNSGSSSCYSFDCRAWSDIYDNYFFSKIRRFYTSFYYEFDNCCYFFVDLFDLKKWHYTFLKDYGLEIQILYQELWDYY
ncbi:MAG: MarC family protein [Aliarcobacter sp.]|nr:MarC family protein [Aliarcobacter sp.]